MADLYPYIYSDDAKKQAEFYVKALGGEILMVRTFGEMPEADEDIKDKVLHLRLKAAGQVFFMSDSVMEPVQHGNSLDLALIYRDPEEARKAFDGLAKDGKVMMPFGKQFWGMFGRVQDPFGIRWQISTED